MARLPIPGSDDGSWGTVLNGFLSVSHNADGSLQTSAIQTSGGITNSTSAGGDLSGTYPNPTVSQINGVGVSGTPSTGQVLTATNSSAATWQTPSVDPAVFGLSMWTTSLFEASLTIKLSAQTFYGVLVRAPQTATLTKLGTWVTVAGSGAGTGINGLALYSESGTKLAVTGDMTSQFSTTGYVEGTLTSSYTVTAGTNYYLFYINNFSTGPTIATNGSAGNFPTIRGHYPAVVMYSQTSFPASVTPSTMSVGNLPIFFTAGT